MLPAIRYLCPSVESVTIQFYKNPDILHWGFDGLLLGDDDYGRWVALPKGSRRWKGEIEWRPTGEDAVQCFPHDGWWVLHYNGPAVLGSHFVDISTQPTWREGRMEMIDLDLDLIVFCDGTVQIEDEDEFAVHQIQFGYTPVMIERARAETEELAARLRRREEPFFEVAESWLQRVTAIPMT